MRFGQLIEYNNRNQTFFLKNYAANEARRLVPDLFFFFFLKKGFIWDIPNFAFLEKGLRTVSPQHFEHYFS